MAKTAAEINAERIADIISEQTWEYPRWGVARPLDLGRKIVEAFPELRPAQQEMLADGTTRTIALPLPWTP